MHAWMLPATAGSMWIVLGLGTVIAAFSFSFSFSFPGPMTSRVGLFPRYRTQHSVLYQAQRCSTWLDHRVWLAGWRPMTATASDARGGAHGARHASHQPGLRLHVASHAATTSVCLIGIVGRKPTPPHSAHTALTQPALSPRRQARVRASRGSVTERASTYKRTRARANPTPTTTASRKLGHMAATQVCVSRALESSTVTEQNPWAVLDMLDTRDVTLSEHFSLLLIPLHCLRS